MRSIPDPDPDSALSPDDLPVFAPVPLARRRRDGWTPERQVAFILLLRRTGVVSAAARAVGCSAQSAYKLRERPGAEGFAAAWDDAVREGFLRAWDLAIDRAMNGYTVPRFYRGRQVATVHRYDNVMAVRALNAAGRLPPRRGGGAEGA